MTIEKTVRDLLEEYSSAEKKFQNTKPGAKVAMGSGITLQKSTGPGKLHYIYRGGKKIGEFTIDTEHPKEPWNVGWYGSKRPEDLLDTIDDIVRKAATMKEGFDPVDKDELKGKHKDRKDKDIDNDGDVDDSDEYLHRRRKAISKAIDKNKDK